MRENGDSPAFTKLDIVREIIWAIGCRGAIRESQQPRWDSSPRVTSREQMI